MARALGAAALFVGAKPHPSVPAGDTEVSEGLSDDGSEGVPSEPAAATGHRESPQDATLTHELPPVGLVRRTVHTVDWAMLMAIRQEVLSRSAVVCTTPEAADAAKAAADAKRSSQAVPDCERATTADELVECWLEVSARQQADSGEQPLNGRDKAFIEIRVTQSMHEVDTQCNGQVDIDAWVYHMLLTRSSCSAMRAMLQLNRLLESALLACPSVLVTLQHAYEVVRETADAALAPQEASEEEVSSVALPFSEVVGIFARKLWQFRPGSRHCKVARKPELPYKGPDEFVSGFTKAMGLDAESVVSPADFLALCLGRKEFEVTLHLYDLSRGVASRLAPWLLNERLDGVWHTGLVVYGKEYYFGGEIYFDTPGETGFGRPRISVALGSTLRQRDELHAFVVDHLKPVFNRDVYDAACNNCNHFTDRAAMYLVGRHIPEDVLKQPDILMRTNLGRALRPVLTQVLGQYFEPKRSAEEIPAAAALALKQASRVGADAGDAPRDLGYSTTFSL